MRASPQGAQETDSLLGTLHEASQPAESSNERPLFSKASAPMALNAYENLLPSLGALQPFSPHKLGQDMVRDVSNAVFKTSLAVACDGFCRRTLVHMNGDLLPGGL